MKERPILFSAPMVRAILEGRKTQTRRIIKPQPPASCVKHENAAWNTKDGRVRQAWRLNDPRHPGGLFLANCPYGKPDDRLWVRESFAYDGEVNGKEFFLYAATDSRCQIDSYEPVKWTSSIHMPRRASRIDLLIKDIRAERLHDISEADAIAEGLPYPSDAFPGHFVIPAGCHVPPVPAYQYLWEQIYGSESWADNPWLWVVEFERVKP